MVRGPGTGVMQTARRALAIALPASDFTARPPKAFSAPVCLESTAGRLCRRAADLASQCRAVRTAYTDSDREELRTPPPTPDRGV